jgi:hypothetical protein
MKPLSGSASASPTLRVPDGYSILNVGETIQAGDLFLHSARNEWLPVIASIGRKVPKNRWHSRAARPIRRAAPAASAEQDPK